MKVIGYVELQRRIHGQFEDERVPFDGSWELTNRCNLRCRHCWINQPAGGREAQAGELSTQSCLSIVDQIVAEGCLSLVLTGGEPLLRTDFAEIYRHAKRAGLLVTLFTNGTLLDSKVLTLLSRWPPHSIEVSLYGASRQTYDRVCGVPSAFDACVAGLQSLVRDGFHVYAKSQITRANIADLPAMKAFCSELGIPFRFDAVLNPRVDGDPGPMALGLPVADVVDLDLGDEERRQDFHDFCRRQVPAVEASGRLYQCGAGAKSFHIDAEGRLSACMMVRASTFDLRRGSFRDGWQGFLRAAVSAPRSRTEPCGHCDLVALCDQCPGWAELVHGDPEAPVDYLCKLAKLREATFGSRKPAE